MRVLLCLSLIFIACKKNKIKVAQVQPIAVVLVAKVKNIDYDSCKAAILTIKKTNRKKWEALPKNSQEKIFREAVVQTIVPAWIGTPWDFNGITEIPQKGKIACGYFVTTVLRDAGLELERIKLAQAASQKIITTLALKKDIKLCCNKPIESFITLIKNSGYGLFVVGLDNHTGFIYNDGTQVYFIHSTFMGTRNVQKEIAANSKVLIGSKYKIVGKVSSNEGLLRKWVSSN
jgi:hypothetical protein